MDYDNLPDEWEMAHFGNYDQTDDGDPDNDGLTNLGEYQHGTDPMNADTDSDGLPDGWEADNALSPLSAFDAALDADSDGLTNLQEYSYGTNPRNADSDNDGLDDAQELNTYNTDPLNNDSDDDGMSDGWEIENGFDPNDDSDAALDPDSDGLTNLQEYDYGSDPSLTDSDGDGLSDYDEIFIYVTSPLYTDTDGDGVWDGWEVLRGSDPNDSADGPADAPVRLAGGDTHSLFVCADGTMLACGNALYGRLGTGATSGNTSVVTRVLAPSGQVPLADIAAVAAGFKHTLGMDADGALWSWGRNTYGRLGDNTTTDRFLPVQVHGPNDVGTLDAIMGVEAGEYFSVAVRADGTVWAWGYTSTLPLIVVENYGAGDVPSATYQTAQVFVYEVDEDTGLSALANGPDACFRIGIHTRGQTSGGWVKAQYRVEVRDEYDEDLDYDLLGLPDESDWVFNGPYVDKALIRNPLVFALGREMGMEAPRTAAFEMFLNTNGFGLASSEYRGVYNLLETLKVGDDRTNIAELAPGENSEPEVSGGYMMAFDRGSGLNATGWGIGIFEPTDPTSQQRNWMGAYLDDFAATLGAVEGQPNDSGAVSADPVTGYPAYIDVSSFVGLMVINELFVEQDGYVRSDYMFKDRGGKLNKGPLWDYNLVAGNGTSANFGDEWLYQRSYNRRGENNYQPDWFVPLMRSPDFRQAFIDRWYALRAGPLGAELDGLIEALAEPLAGADGPADRNYIKWNAYHGLNILAESKIPGTAFATPRTDTWQEQIDFIKNWLSARAAWIDRQFPAPVTLSPAQGVIVAGGQVALSASAGEQIYYTLDGSDPRAAGGSVAPDALTPGGASITLTETATVTARAFDGTDWSAPSTAVYVVGTPASAADLVVTEIHYHPANPSEDEMAADPTYRDDDFEFIELKNISGGTIDLSGMSFVDGISFAMPAPTVLGPGDYMLLVKNKAAFEERYGAGLPVAGTYADKLNNDGEILRLVDVSGEDIFHFAFNDSWYTHTDGEGYSLVLLDPHGSSAFWGRKPAWRPSMLSGGSPGFDRPGLVPGSIAINEALTHTDEAPGDWIELRNRSLAAIDVGGWYLSDDFSQPIKYRIADGTVLQPSAFLTFTQTSHFGETATDPGRLIGFGLSEHGDDICLTAALSDGTLLGYRERVRFLASDREMTFGRYEAGDGDVDFPTLSFPTFGTTNSQPLVGPVIINEVMFHAVGEEPDFLELLNITDRAVPLYDGTNTWRVNGIGFTFPGGGNLAAAWSPASCGADRGSGGLPGRPGRSSPGPGDELSRKPG